jgi:hypothetical protein
MGWGIRDLRTGVTESLSLLERDAVSLGKYLPTIRKIVLLSSSGSRNLLFLNHMTRMMEARQFFETSETTQPT